ncbi:MAG TPA: ParB/RepB/Spo0J family partition protein [Aeriscardovia aeriphila]|uniref:ParB/RepB/Spo0J family partition protein n=1 Tax=Aeriscardovia aeriphila TaxID=218139 RepID=A0A921FTS4_9BIFI|nr:ParB/RepB/Spo0J family partition protein [Aeriscardovia aeriphila]
MAAHLGLGKGLGALFPNLEPDKKKKPATAANKPADAAQQGEQGVSGLQGANSAIAGVNSGALGGAVNGANGGADSAVVGQAPLVAQVSPAPLNARRAHPVLNPGISDVNTSSLPTGPGMAPTAPMYAFTADVNENAPAQQAAKPSAPAQAAAENAAAQGGAEASAAQPSATSEPSTPAKPAKRVNKVKANLAEQKKAAGSSTGSARKSARRKHLPSWDEISRRPSDIFFGDDSLDLTPKAAQAEQAKTVATPTAAADNAQPEVVEKAEATSQVETANTEVAANVTGAVTEAAAENGNNADNGQAADDEALRPIPHARYEEVPAESVVPNPKQPRTIFDEKDLEQLSGSIQQVGVLEPIVVREISEDDSRYKDGARFELIMGERRLRASKLAGLQRVPAIVRTTSDVEMLREALLENLQRVQLNPLEEAAAYQQMMEDFGLTQEKLAQAVSKSRPQIANTLRLLQLPPNVQKRVAAGVLTAGHARALLSLKDPATMEKLTQKIVKEGLSVRSTEELVTLAALDADPSKQDHIRSRAFFWKQSGWPTRLENHFDTKVTMRGTENKGRIEITFSSKEELDRITSMLMSTKSEADDGWV